METNQSNPAAAKMQGAEILQHDNLETVVNVLAGKCQRDGKQAGKKLSGFIAAIHALKRIQMPGYALRKSARSGLLAADADFRDGGLMGAWLLLASGKGGVK